MSGKSNLVLNICCLRILALFGVISFLQNGFATRSTAYAAGGTFEIIDTTSIKRTDSLVGIGQAQANNESPEISAPVAGQSISVPESPTRPREVSGFRVEQILGTGYSSDRGVLAIYRIDAQGSFWSLNNNFAVILDRLALTLRQHFEVTDFVSVAAEAPATLDWQLPLQFAFGYAGRGKVNLHNRRDPRDERPGWSLWADATVQANGQERISKQIASFAPDPLSSSPSSRYRAGGITGATFFNEFLSPSLSVSSFYDLGSLKPTDVMVSASIAHNWGSREQATKILVTVPVVSSQPPPLPPPMPKGPNQISAAPAVSKRFVLEQIWGHLMGRVEYSTVGLATLIGYRF